MGEHLGQREDSISFQNGKKVTHKEDQEPESSDFETATWEAIRQWNKQCQKSIEWKLFST